MMSDDFIERVPEAHVLSPCVNICRLDPATRRCVGCKRTMTEIGEWSNATDARRQAILDALAQRD